MDVVDKRLCVSIRSVTVVSVDSEVNQGFLVRSEMFCGTLTELAYTLRTRGLRPQDIDVLQLVKDYLAYFELRSAQDMSLASEALPMVARIIELKVRLLLPKPPQAENDDEVILEETLETVVMLEELEDAISFLRQRRSERRVVLAAKGPRPDYPRPLRPIRVQPERLAEMASRYSVANYFELTVDRWTVSAAMAQLRKRLKVLKRTFLRDVLENASWAVLTVTFAAMLELVKEGELRAEQAEAFGPIELLTISEASEREAA